MSTRHGVEGPASCRLRRQGLRIGVASSHRRLSFQSLRERVHPAGLNNFLNLFGGARRRRDVPIDDPRSVAGRVAQGPVCFVVLSSSCSILCYATPYAEFEPNGELGLRRLWLRLARGDRCCPAVFIRYQISCSLMKICMPIRGCISYSRGRSAAQHDYRCKLRTSFRWQWVALGHTIYRILCANS